MECKKKKVKRYCIAYGCTNSAFKIPGLTLFALPKEPERRQIWLNSIGREDLLDKENLKFRHYEVCEKHFEDSAITLTTAKRLKKDMVPSLNLSSADSPSNCSSPTTDQSIDDQSTSDQSLNNQQQPSKALSHKNTRKRKTQHELNKIKNEVESDSLDEIKERLKKLVDWQNKLRNNFKGYRYDAEYKVSALNLHYSGPQTYRCLQTVLKLPSKSALCRYKFNIPPKLDCVLQSLSIKLKSIPDNAKFCTICVNEMVLKRHLYYDIKSDEVIGFQNIDGKNSPEIASNAYVIMLQGLFVNWSQPIAYAFLASTKHYDELDTWMNLVIEKLFGMGIVVKAVISDQDSNFDKYAKVVKHVTIDEPYFFADGRKIFYIFDVPHLLKCVRDDLLARDYHLDDEIISWKYVRMLYNDQKERNLILIPKITDAHVNPDNFQRMKVKYAAEIFSRTVYAALETYIDFGKIPEDAIKTGEFIKNMDNLFDVLNSSKIKAAKELQSAFRMSDDQKNVLKEAQNIFARIKSIDRTTGKENTNITTFANFQISIQAVIQLFEDLKEENFKYMFTRRINQESLEDFFRAVREQDACLDPTPIQFTRAFSKLFFVNMLKNSPRACDTDILDTLLKAEDVMRTKIITSESRKSLVHLEGETDYRIDLPEENALTYVTGYLLFKCAKKHTCRTMVKQLRSMKDISQSMFFTRYKAYNKESPFYGSLKVPPAQFLQYVGKLENVLTSKFDKFIQHRPGSTLFQLLKDVPPFILCNCFPTEYLLKLFVRLRIYTTLKHNNCCLRSSKKSIKQHLKVEQL